MSIRFRHHTRRLVPRGIHSPSAESLVGVERRALSLFLDLFNPRDLVESIWGEPLRRAKAAGAAVPKLDALYAQLKKLTVRG